MTGIPARVGRGLRLGVLLCLPCGLHPGPAAARDSDGLGDLPCQPATTAALGLGTTT